MPPEETKTETPVVVEGNPAETPVDSEPKQTQMDTSPPIEEPQKPIYEGLTGEFKTVEELVAHTKGLEKKLFQQKVDESKKPVEKTVETTESTESIENLYWTDPDKALSLKKEEWKKELRAELRQEEDRKKAEENFYKQLYTEHPDLKNMKQVVDSVVLKKWGTIKELSSDDAKKFIAKESRAFANDLKASWGVKETELPEGQVVTTGASGSTPTKKTVEPKVLSFGDQLKQLQSKTG